MTLDKIAIDGSVGALAVSTPVWVEYVSTYGGLVMLIGGIILLALRIALAWKEWNKSNG